MESTIRSKKRKQRSSESDPFGGIFTRSRSQIYFHRNRSGYARSDANRSRNGVNLMRGEGKSLVKEQQSEGDVGLVSNHVSVKDLRARRVFSPATVADDGVIGDVGLEGELGVCKKNGGDVNGVIGDVGLEGELCVCKKNGGDVNGDVKDGDVKDGDLGVLESVDVDVHVGLENVVDCSLVRENNVTEAVVQMKPTIEESEQKKRHEMISVANEIADTKGFMSKNQSSVTSLRGRKKVFKSPSSFSYRRLLPYLTDSANDDSSTFEIVETTLPNALKSSNAAPNMVSIKHEEVSPVSSSSKLANGLLNNAKSSEKQVSNGVNDGLVSTFEGSDVVQKNQEDALNGTLEECEQMTPPDSDIHSKSKTDNSVPLSSKLKPALKSCSRKKVLQTPTSFSHRRLLPFLMSVAGDHSSSLKDKQPLKVEKAIGQNQQPPSQSLLNQDEKTTTSNETSNSPTSTLIPVDRSTDISKSLTLVSNDNILDANGPDKEGGGLISPLEVNLQDKTVKPDSCIKLELSPPKDNLKCVEEATIKATLPCIEQSCREDLQTTVKESPHQQLLQITETHGENIKNGILKRTPRGCRGICNCLNCTSFRLHAERSFEFTKNQLHDAEEVALELINDLTCLRNILETTTTYSNSLDTVKEKQVKEACAKALYKEQLARARLAQMNEDLSIHCRSMNLLRPKVTFANKIEEKVISKD